MFVILNWIAAAMLAIAFAISFAIYGTKPEGPPFIMAGILLLLGDLAFRATKGERQWLHPDAGGMIFYAPVWGWGILWLVLGIVKAH